MNVSVAVVTFEADFMARTYVEDTGLAWPLLIDFERKLYRGYDMLQASFWDVWGPKTWFAYAKELLRGAKLTKSDADLNQRGGDVLIDPGGIVRVHHVGDGPADRPPVDSLLESVRLGASPSARAALPIVSSRRARLPR